MKRKISGLQLRFIILGGSIFFAVILAFFVVRNTVIRQNDDAQFVALAANQSLLSQRVSKLCLLIDKDFAAQVPHTKHIDTFRTAVYSLRKLHYALLDQNKTHHNSMRTDSLLRASTPYFESTFAAAKMIIANENKDLASQAIDVIEKNDQVLTQATNRILDSYRAHAESKMTNLKITLLIVATVVFTVIVLAFIYIMKPSLDKLELNNYELNSLNEQLQGAFQELQATEEEIRGNMDHIHSLKDHLEAKEKQYRDLVENANEIIYELDVNGRFVYVNPTTELITGLSRDELFHKPYWKIILPEYKKEVSDFYTQQFKEGREKSCLEFPIRTDEGRIVWLSQNVSLAYDDDGNVRGFSVIARDITQLKETQDKLSKSEQLYKLISNNSGDLISLYSTVNENLVRVYISPSVKDILGYEQEEIVGRSPFDFIHPEDVDRKREIYSKALSGQWAKVEFRALKKDSTQIWMESSSQPYFDEQGKVAGFQTSARDITERKLTELKLIEAKQKAEEATNAKSNFLSMMSHEIRTPMNAVIGLTNFLLEENPRESQLKHLNLLRFSGENLLTIINDILDFSKIEAGKIAMERVPIRLKSFLNNVVLPMKMKANEKGILLLMKLEEKVPEVILGDPVRISQVITNLLNNAIKFTKKGSITFDIEYKGVADTLHHIFFRVKDSGIGIEQDKLESIFDSFSQANSYTTRKFGGTGLGLSITKRLLHLMGSEIKVQSKPGWGAEFSFTLAVEESYSIREEEHFLSALPLDTHHQEENGHVLLAEDNEVNQIVAMNYLEKWGYKVSTANNGKEVLRLIQQKDFHIVLIDLQMPEMDGYQATQMIREMDDPYFKLVPIIALTASAMADVEEKLLSIGMNDYISKPFKAVELAEKIRTHKLQDISADHERSLQSSLDAYSGGNQEVNLDLARRMVKNINDLQEAMQIALDKDDIEGYIRSSHKMRTTVSILKSDQFTNGLEEVKQALLLRKETSEQLEKRVEQFNSICKKKIEELTDFYVSALS